MENRKNEMTETFINEIFNKNSTVETEPKKTNEDYIRAAYILAECSNERMPIVISLLRQAGLTIPEKELPKKHTVKIKQIDKRLLADFPNTEHRGRDSAVTRIDSEASQLLQLLKQQTGLTMIILASQLIKEGSKTLGIEQLDEEEVKSIGQ